MDSYYTLYYVQKWIKVNICRQVVNPDLFLDKKVHYQHYCHSSTAADIIPRDKINSPSVRLSHLTMLRLCGLQRVQPLNWDTVIETNMTEDKHDITRASGLLL